MLELDLTEVPVTPDSDDALARWRVRGRHQLPATLRTLHRAAADRRVGGLIAKIGGPLPWTVAQELRLGVQAFAAGGKPTLAWAESFGEGAGDLAGYVLATAFDELWLQPGGGLGLLGVGVETTFVRSALDRLGLHPQIEQRHEFKNAPDQLLRDGYSAAHRAALDRLAQSVFDDAVEAIADRRRLTAAEVRERVDAGPYTAAEARRAGLVDALGYRDEAYAALRRRIGQDCELLFADRWRPRRRARLPRRGHVALVEVRGTLVTGRSRRAPTGRRCGSDTVTAALRAALADDRARAVVLQVDSPGGSAVASEAVWREVCRLGEAGKPVVVSMGRAAASGGYYIACPAAAIVALPATLTGSIGVFGGKVVTQDLLSRLGVSTDSVAHGERALMFSSRRDFSPAERDRLATTIDAVYDDFVGKVATGRGRSVADIEAIARGRVWTGRDALGLGLVDQLGGLTDAVRLARTRGGLPADAPVRPARRRARLTGLTRPTNSEDPRWAAGAPLTVLAGTAGGITTALGLAGTTVLQMPPVTLR